MIHSSEGPTTQDDVFQEAARQARRCRKLQQATMWALSPFVLIFFIQLAINAQGPLLKSLLFCAMLLTSPVLPLFVWTNVAWARQRRAYSKLNAMLAVMQSDVPESVSPSLIGPLLQVALSDSRDGDCLLASTNLLVAMLGSVQEDAQVVLTANQRHHLHKIVLHGWWDWEQFVRAQATIGDTEYCALRPPTIRALGVLGNSTSIPVLERFARKTDDPDLRLSALQSIEQICERLQYGPEQMLRASRAPERPDTLLRAVASETLQYHDPQQLLRAASANTALRAESERQRIGEQK